MSLRDLSDEKLISNLKMLVRQERENTASVIEHLCEMDDRDLAVRRAFPSLFEYCTRELGYSPAAAYFRIRATRAAKRFPCVIAMLRSGEISLEALVRLHPHLNGDSGRQLLERAKGKSVREIEFMVAPLAPKLQPHDSIRVVATRGRDIAQTDHQSLFPLPVNSSQRAKKDILSRVHFNFTADEELLALLNHAQEILRHKYPNGRLEDVFRDALIALLKQRDPNWRLLGKLPRAANIACVA